MRDIFKGKVYPFLYPDQMEPAPQTTAGSAPTIFLLSSFNTPQSAQHCLAILADIIVRRKAMQQNPISWWPGYAHQGEQVDASEVSTENNKILDSIFLKLIGEGKIYHQKDVWFLKVDDQLPIIANKIKTKQYMITPERKSSNYRGFFESHHQWSISTYYHSGYSLPIHVCPKCRHQKISTLIQSACDKCNTPVFRKDSPQLASWFANSALIFDSISKYHYGDSARTLLTVERENIKTIAGILILGIHLYGDLPFREMVVIESEYRPAGHRDSDTKRFSISSSPGHYHCYMLPSEDAKRQFISFANKIWNASRFVFMHTGIGEEVEIDFNASSEIDQWFAHLLTSKTEEINDLMEQYRINEAIILVHKMFKNDFCKWYLELIKPRLDKPYTRAMLRFSLLELLKLLYPFLPSICLRLSNLIYLSSASIASQTYPSFSSNMVFPQQYGNVELLKKLIQATRKTREETGIKPGIGIYVTLYSKSKKERDMISRLIPYFNHMTGSNETIVTGLFPQKVTAIQGEYLNWKILVTFGSDAEKLQIHSRLESKFIHLAKKIEELENLPPSKKTKQKLQELFKRKERLNKLIHDIS